MLSLPSHTFHEMQPLDIVCFKPFKQSFKAYIRDMWAKANIGNKVKRQVLAQWVSLGLKKALIKENIKSGFMGIGIQPLNKEALVHKVGAPIEMSVSMGDTYFGTHIRHLLLS